MNRRTFLMAGGSLFGLSLADVAKAVPASNKKIIFIFMSGGMSHQDSWIVKPNAIPSQRPINGSIQTIVPGLLFGSDFPCLSCRTDKLRVVHSFSHNNGGHAGASHWNFTGYDNRMIDNDGVATKPSFGSMAAKVFGPTTASGLPNYVRTQQHVGDGATWLGAANNPFDITGDGRNNLRLTMQENNFTSRRQLLASLDSINRQVDRSGLLSAMDSFQRQATDLLLGNAREVFDLSKESGLVRAKYGETPFGRQLLTARRLVEAGTSFVSCVHGGHDLHTNISQGYKNIIPSADKAISALIDDVYQRGLQNEVLLVITTEFGRTQMNSENGRDHWSRLIPLLFSGGGITNGGILGEADARNSSPKTTPLTPAMLGATILTFLGIPLTTTIQDGSGRPQFLVESQNPITIL